MKEQAVKKKKNKKKSLPAAAVYGDLCKILGTDFYFQWGDEKEKAGNRLEV